MHFMYSHLFVTVGCEKHERNRINCTAGKYQMLQLNKMCCRRCFDRYAITFPATVTCLAKGGPCAKNGGIKP